MSTLAIIIIALCVAGVINSFFHLIKDIVVAKHVANKLEILGAICTLEEDENEEEVEE